MFPRLSLVALFSLVTVAVAFPSDFHGLHGIHRRAAGRKCGSNPSPEAVSKKEDAFASILAQGLGTDAPEPITILVNFNVIYASSDPSGGYIQ